MGVIFDWDFRARDAGACGRSSEAERRVASPVVAGSSPAGRSTLRALGVHIFAGGFSIGVQEHFQLLGHLERTNYGVASWRKYRPGVPVHVDRAARWAGAIEEYRGKVDLLESNPPCSIWSVASVGQSVHGDKSALLDWTRDVVRVGREVEARVVVIESVRRAMTDGAHFYESLWRENRDRWPGMMWVLVNAVDHGVPQYRPRLFVVFAPEVFQFKRPAAAPRTVLEAIAGAPDDDPIEPKSLYAPRGLNEEVMECISLLEPGQRLGQLSVAAVRAVAPALAEKLPLKFDAHLPYRLRSDEACPVVYSSPKYVHPTEQRMLTLRELMRLTGYPDDFEVVDRDQLSACRQLGKTVVPQVGAWLAGEVAAYLRGERACRGAGQAVHDCASRGRVTQLTVEDL